MLTDTVTLSYYYTVRELTGNNSKNNSKNNPKNKKTKPVYGTLQGALACRLTLRARFAGVDTTEALKCPSPAGRDQKCKVVRDQNSPSRNKKTAAAAVVHYYYKYSR